MTWESVVCFSVVVVCSSVLLGFRWHLENKDSQESVSPDEFEQMKTAIGQVKTDNEAMQKLADETKKMLSTANLAKSFGGPRT